MVFSSISFLILFLPITVLLYYIVPNIKLKNFILLLASLIFYGLGEPVYIFLLIGSVAVNYIVTIQMCKVQRTKLVLAFLVAINLAVLAFFKYLSTGLVLPIGISFYTFQILSYDIDVYRDKKIAQRNFFDLLLYISFFPQLVAGPIVKYYDIKEQISNRKASLQGVAEGLRRFIYGLGKKVLLANTIGYVVDEIYAFNTMDMNVLIAWAVALLYCLQIYYDFSGYSDMAIGLGRMFGLEFKENFRYPYMANSIKDFWRRWHISLSTWFKEYLYIPLGGNRQGKPRTYINKYIVFFLTGLWHGANITFVIWGLIHGTFSVLEECKSFAKKVTGKIVGHIYTIVVVSIAFVFFRSENVVTAFRIIAQMFTDFDISTAATRQFVSFFDGYTIFIVVLGILGVINWKERFSKILKNPYVEGLVYVGSVACLVWCALSLAAGSYNPFIYFRF